MDNPFHVPGRRGRIARSGLLASLVLGSVFLAIDWGPMLVAGRWPPSLFFLIVVVAAVWIVRMALGWPAAAAAAILVVLDGLLLALPSTAVAAGWSLVVFVALALGHMAWSIARSLGPAPT